nr:hypothetical protein FA04_29355 [Ensifer adhaerens]
METFVSEDGEHSLTFLLCHVFGRGLAGDVSELGTVGVIVQAEFLLGDMNGSKGTAHLTPPTRAQQS